MKSGHLRYLICKAHMGADPKVSRGGKPPYGSRGGNFLGVSRGVVLNLQRGVRWSKHTPRNRGRGNNKGIYS